MNKLLTKPWQDLSDVQIEYLCRVLADGNSQVPMALEMLTGQHIEQHSVHIEVAPSRHVAQLMHIPDGAMAVVVCGIRGDIGGDFLFLQTQSDLQILSRVMSPILTGEVRHPANKETMNQTPDWLVKKRSNSMNIEGQMMETIAELGNTLFGVYLMSLHKNCNLTVYQDVPDTSLMGAQQAVLGRMRSQLKHPSHVAVVIEINYMIGKFALKAWLVLLPMLDGLGKILDGMDAFNALVSRPVQVASLSNETWDI